MIEAKTGEELLHELERLSYKCRQSQTTSTKRLEIYGITVMLHKFVRKKLLNYPVVLEHIDRPDFILTLNDGNSIGIEHTLSVAQNQGHTQVQIRQAYGAGDDIGHPRKLPYRESDLESLQKELETNTLLNTGWYDGVTELEWPKAVGQSVNAKIQVVKKPGFNRFQQNWLLIDDGNGIPLEITRQIEQDHVSSRMLKSLHDFTLHDKAYDVFDRIYVLATGNLCEFDEGGYRVV